ncbi:MAG: putative signaling protein [Symbiobacteriaceae bacterium]|jgi:TolB protein|nr:putative signaling protein [Symbiobacteriaceae bacterium]
MRRLALFMLCLALLAAGCGRPSTGARFPGRLAYERAGKVYILEGSREREVGFGRTPLWSHDGAWLAYVGSDTPGGPAGLRMVKADGTGQVSFPGLQADNWRLAWSPTDTVLAVGTEKGLVLARPTGTVLGLADQARSISSLAWARDGARLAYVTTELREQPPPVDTLWTLAVAGGRPVQVMRDEENGIILADWWPDGQSLLYWLAPGHSASIAADGLPLRRLDLATGASNHLETMLLNPRWISWAPDGQKFLAVTGAGRQAWADKTLSICGAQGCGVQARPAGTVWLDGVWAPTGDQVAFVQAEAREPIASPEGWMETRRLWTSALTGHGGAVEVAGAGGGVYSPQWARDGRHLLYARDGALWYLAIDGGAPVKLARIEEPDQIYYGQITAPVAWYQP